MDDLTISSQSQLTTLLTGLQDLYTGRHLADVILCAEGHEFPCHRAVLAASSPYFRAMFLANMAETGQSKIRLHDIEPSALSSILNFCYFGQISVNSENVQNIVVATSMLEMLPLRDQCAEYMSEFIDLTNCVDTLRFGEYHACDVLKKSARNFILQNFQKESLIDHLSELPVDEFIDIISDDDLNVEKEEYVFEMVMKWLKYDLEERRKHLTRLMANVRLALLADEYLSDVVSKEIILADNTFLKGQIQMAKLYKTAQSLESDECGCEFQFNTMQRLGMFNRKMIIFSGGAHPPSCRSFSCYDPGDDTCYVGLKPHPTFDLKYKIDFHQLVVTEENRIYFLGGIFYSDYHFEDSASAFTDVLRYDPVNKNWLPCPSMNEPRCAFAAVARGEDIVAIGGKTALPKGNALSSVEYFDAEQSKWLTLTPLPFALYFHCAIFWQNAIFVLGGRSDEGDVQMTNFKYDFETENWTVLANLSKPRAEFGAAVIGNEIVVVCGMSEVNTETMSVEAYDPAANKWRFFKDFPDERKTCAVVNFDGRLIVCGGQQTHHSRITNASRTLERADVWEYDFKADDWRKVARSAVHLNCHGYAVATVNTKFVRKI